MTSEDSIKQFPSSWASDSLSEFFDDAFGNLLATFARKKPQYSVLKNIDQCFSKIAENFTTSSDLLEPLFFIRSHSAYRAGSQLAMSGQSTESFCLFRSCLESALYGLHINNNSALGEVWIQRHQNEKALKKVRGSFANRAIMNTLDEVDPNLCKTVSTLYDRTIDFGGHPNERSITSNLLMASNDTDVQIRQLYLQGDSVTLEHGLKSAAQIGVSALYILRHVFREKFDILDVTTTLDELRDFL